MRTLKMLALVLCALFVTLTAGCAISEETAEVVPPTAAVVPTTTAPVEPAEPTTEPAAELPLAVTYDLGDATVVQANFPEDSRFRNMPVRLNGVIAAPAGEGPYPVVVILHGTHPGCPVDEMGVDRWPCDPADEQANYSGFAYLVSELAARGYVALAPNINAENTFGFGEPVSGERLAQLLDLHLNALKDAATGGENAFGVALSGVADVGRLTLIGHSRGGEMANYLTRQYGLGTAEGAAEHGYGPVAGLLLVAPAHILQGSTGADVPLAVILSACDGDVIGQDGQVFYEAVRFQTDHTWATTVLLEGANHNGFNTILGGDMIAHTGRSGCQSPLAPEEQRQFLVDYAADFLTALFGAQDEATAAKARLGLDLAQPAPAELFGRAARINSLPASADQLRLFAPGDEIELTTHLRGGATVAEGATLFFCPPGYTVEAELAACRRPNFVNPANPVMAIISWSGLAEVRFEMPTGQGEMGSYTTLTLRAALDPLSELNPADTAQSFSVRLTDGHGATASVVVGPDEPALQYVSGEFTADETFTPGLLDAIVQPTTVRVPLASFAGIDLNDVAEVALVFDQTTSGTLFIADVAVDR
ncbi:MAG: hypothetical protein K1X50_02120 [Candidatus Promineofilum sp.]|nr:hypothetical protein [Promineifilum sp.]